MQKKILLSAVNAKYIHSSLAVRYLKKYCDAHIEGIDIAEFSINDSIGSMLKRLYSSDADIYGFSCYIWNISLVLDICSSLKKAKPEASIILGGPEVSYDPASVLADNSSIDYVVIGEGEATLLDLLKCLTSGSHELSGISGIAYRKGNNISVNSERPLIPALDELPFPYDSLDGFENKIIYYETSRGCPFNCQYCLSSTIRGVRYLSMSRLKQDIKSFVDAGLRQVKLVDRTFNCDIGRSIEIMEYIISLNSSTNFHFEIAADLINDAFLETVKKAPTGMFQFEIGVQSTNSKTLSEIKRTMNLNKVKTNVAKLVSFENAHIHLDLIAGLPYEDLSSFRNSFNDVYILKPDMLQLGFLKLLKGSGIRRDCRQYGMEHHDFPPYEVIKTDWLPFKDLLLLKDIEQVLEYYYNSGRFRHTLDFLLLNTGTEPFDFYLKLSGYWNSKGYFNSPKSVNELFTILVQFISEAFTDTLDSEKLSLMNEYLKLDWLLYSRSGNMPAVIKRFDHAPLKEQLQTYLKNSLTKTGSFSGYHEMSPRELLKHIGYEVLIQNIFEDVPVKGEIVMFFPLRTDLRSKKPFYAAVSLAEVTQSM